MADVKHRRANRLKTALCFRLNLCCRADFRLDVQFSANFVRNFVAESFVISPVQLQQTEDVVWRNAGVEFPQKSTRVLVSTVEVRGGKLYVRVITGASYLP